jgi:tetratricopeptide (TPR) repeat protein
MNLVNELQASAENDDVLTVLRKTTRLASKLGRDDISEWLLAEQNGYPRGDAVPAYRRVRGRLAMNVLGYVPAGYGVGRHAPADLHYRVAGLAAVAQDPATSPRTVEQRLKDGERAQAGGDYAVALAAYRAAEEEASRVGAEDRQAEAALRAGDTIQSWATLDQGQARLWPEAERLYARAILLGAPSQRALALNNLGTALLRQRKNQEALQAFRQIDFAAVAPSRHYLYHFNFGRALEASGEKGAAYERYLRAIALNPDSDSAVIAAFRLLEGGAEPRVAEAANLAHELLLRDRPTGGPKPTPGGS